MNESALEDNFKKIGLYFKNGQLLPIEGLEKITLQECLKAVEYLAHLLPLFYAKDEDTEAKVVNELQLIVEGVAEQYA